VVPNDAGDKTVVWSSSDKAIATVSDEGIVTAVAAGTATITATTKDDGKTAACKVTMKKPQMTMTTAMNGEATVYLAGDGSTVIDWGDGSEPETITLSAFDRSFRDYQKYTHTFSGTLARDIVIDGQNITHMGSFYNQLTALNVSKNTALTYLYTRQLWMWYT
jgi:hypothetical protein